MDEKRQVQKELFEDFVAQDKKRYPKDTISKKTKFTLTLHVEHLILGATGLVLILAVVFSIGVEKGKGIMLNPPHQDNIKEAVRHAETEPSADLKEIEEPLTARDETPKQQAVSLDLLPQESDIYTVQIASYTKQASAESYARSLKQRNMEAFTLKKGSYYVICVGRFGQRHEAESEMRKLRKFYSDCIVRKI
jgi:septal ring-binding cell division protein DamX